MATVIIIDEKHFEVDKFHCCSKFGPSLMISEVERFKKQLGSEYSLPAQVRHAKNINKINEDMAEHDFKPPIEISSNLIFPSSETFVSKVHYVGLLWVY